MCTYHKCLFVPPPICIVGGECEGEGEPVGVGVKWGGL